MDSRIESYLHDNKGSFVRKLKIILRKMLLFIMIFIIGLCVGVMKPWQNGKAMRLIAKVADTADSDDTTDGNTIVTISTIEEILKPASDLITMRYCYTDTDTYENYKQLFGKKVPFTTDKVIFTYDGYISVGMNLSDIKYYINDSNKTINIILPDIVVIANEIDHSSFEYPYQSDSIFNSTDMEDFTKLINSLKEKKVDDIMNNKGFMDSAEENTKRVIEGFLTGSESTKDYTVKFK